MRCKNVDRFIMCLGLTLTMCLAGCSIEDDIPYPTIVPDITAFTVEGLCDASGEGEGTAEIDNKKRTIHLYVNDMVDIRHLRITNVEVTNDAAVTIDGQCYAASATYAQRQDNADGENATAGSTAGQTAFRTDCSRDITVKVSTWQDYEWTLHVEQVINREIEIEGQVGNAVIDASTNVAIVYVANTESLSHLKVNKFSLGGTHGRVTPDPTAEEYADFRQHRRFSVQYAWASQATTWDVYVYTTERTIEPTLDVATNEQGFTVLSGTRPNGIIPTAEYRAEGEETWTTVAPELVKLPTSTSYEIAFDALHNDIQYHCRVTFGDKTLEGEPFYFVGEQLKNSSFESWQIKGDEKRPLYLPWGEGEEPFWDTGNHGATTVGASNSTYAEEDGRRYACLQSKYIVIKFAAGNIFTGSYLATDGSNGVLSFGRPFTSRPLRMTFDFQYKSSTITRTGGEWQNAWGTYITRQLYEGLKGRPDSCNVYIALGDWEPTTYKGKESPYIIKTRPSELHLLDLNNGHLIGYGQMTCGKDVSTWQHETIEIKYRNQRKPKYIIVVASSSKYGDYFTGGESSLLKIDDFKLIY